MTNNALAHVEPIAPINTIPAIREEDALIAAEAAVTGDWSKLAPDQRIQLYGAVCKSMGLNPLTQPFGWFSQGGKLVLYAFKGATDQLRKLHRVDVVSVDQEVADGLLITTVKVKDHTGREDLDIGAVPFGADLKGEARANALMKSITKAKRRATLSLVGLGMLDESEISSIPGARRATLDMTTGEVLGDEPIDADPLARPQRGAATVSQAHTRQVPADTERTEAKKRLMKLAQTFEWAVQVDGQWDYETLDAVAFDHSGKHLKDMDAAELDDLHRTVVIEDEEVRAQRVDRALSAVEAQSA